MAVVPVAGEAAGRLASGCWLARTAQRVVSHSALQADWVLESQGSGSGAEWSGTRRKIARQTDVTQLALRNSAGHHCRLRASETGN